MLGGSTGYPGRERGGGSREEMEDREREKERKRDRERGDRETEERPAEKGRLLYLFTKSFTHKLVYTMELQSLLMLNSTTELCLLLSFIWTGLHPDTIIPLWAGFPTLPLSHSAVPQGCHRHPSPFLLLLRELCLSLQITVHLQQGIKVHKEETCRSLLC